MSIFRCCFGPFKYQATKFPQFYQFFYIQRRFLELAYTYLKECIIETYFQQLRGIFN